MKHVFEVTINYKDGSISIKHILAHDDAAARKRAIEVDAPPVATKNACEVDFCSVRYILSIDGAAARTAK